jgi:hypothetical protein
MLREIVGLAWERFKIITLVIGDVQGRLVMTAFYFTVLIPFGLVSRLFTDPLSLKSKHTPPTWIDRAPMSDKLDDAGRQG